MVNIVLLEPLSINRRAGWLRTIVRVDTVSPRKVSRTRGRCLPRNGDAGRPSHHAARCDYDEAKQRLPLAVGFSFVP